MFGYSETTAEKELQCDTCGRIIKIKQAYLTKPGDVICKICMQAMIDRPNG